MVVLKEGEVVITVPHGSPAVFLAGLQSGIVEMVKSLLSVAGQERELVLDEGTCDGCVHALELLQARLISLDDG